MVARVSPIVFTFDKNEDKVEGSSPLLLVFFCSVEGGGNPGGSGDLGCQVGLERWGTSLHAFRCSLLIENGMT